MRLLNIITTFLFNINTLFPFSSDESLSIVTQRGDSYHGGRFSVRSQRHPVPGLARQDQLQRPCRRHQDRAQPPRHPPRLVLGRARLPVLPHLGRNQGPRLTKTY